MKRSKWLLLAALVSLSNLGTACSESGGGALISEEEAIDRAVEQLGRPAPGTSGVADIENPAAWRTTEGEAEDRLGDPGPNVSERAVWVVQVEGRVRTHGSGMDPGPWEDVYAIGIIDAETGVMFSRRHSAEPFVLPVATDAPGIGSAERFDDRR